MPPSHCNKARQSIMPGEATSIEVKIVEPVVVIPEMDSNSASVKLNPKSEKTKGSAPNIPDNSQAEFVSKKASRRPRFVSCLFLFVSHKDIPIKHEISAADANPNQF